METPGPARSIAAPGEMTVTGLLTALVLKFENVARVSSGPYEVLDPFPPDWPSESASAEIVATSG